MVNSNFRFPTNLSTFQLINLPIIPLEFDYLEFLQYFALWIFPKV